MRSSLLEPQVDRSKMSRCVADVRGVRVELGDGNFKEIRIGDHGEADLLTRLSHKYAKEGTYKAKVQGVTLIRGLRSAASCEGWEKTLDVAVLSNSIAPTVTYRVPLADAAQIIKSPWPACASAHKSERDQCLGSEIAEGYEFHGEYRQGRREGKGLIVCIQGARLLGTLQSTLFTSYCA